MKLKDKKSVQNMSQAEMSKQVSETRQKIVRWGLDSAIKNVHERKALRVKLARLLTEAKVKGMSL